MLFAAAGFAVARSGGETSVPVGAAGGVEGGFPVVLGAPIGLDVEDYLAAALAGAVEASEATPDARFLALVSLSEEISPDTAGSLIEQADLVARRVYLRAPGTGELPEVLPVEAPGDLVAGLTAVYAQTALRKTEEQVEFLALAASIEPVSEQEQGFKAFYEDAARTAGQEAVAYQAGCACVFALVVEATARQLAELPDRAAVRGVELARQGIALVSLSIDPLPPQITGVRPSPREPSGTER